MISAEQVRDLFAYEIDTGELRWRVHRSGVVFNSVAGTISKKRGYRSIMIGRKQYPAHRLVWLWVHGRWPTNQLDHINGKPDDNRISNLRLATQSQNNANTRRPRHNTSGYKGVSWNKLSQKWNAQIGKDGKYIRLGLFNCPKAAHAAYIAAAEKLYGAFARAE